MKRSSCENAFQERDKLLSTCQKLKEDLEASQFFGASAIEEANSFKLSQERLSNELSEAKNTLQMVGSNIVSNSACSVVILTLGGSTYPWKKVCIIALNMEPSALGGAFDQ